MVLEPHKGARVTESTPERSWKSSPTGLPSRVRGERLAIPFLGGGGGHDFTDLHRRVEEMDGSSGRMRKDHRGEQGVPHDDLSKGAIPLLNEMIFKLGTGGGSLHKRIRPSVPRGLKWPTVPTIAILGALKGDGDGVSMIVRAHKSRSRPGCCAPWEEDPSDP